MPSPPMAGEPTRAAAVRRRTPSPRCRALAKTRSRWSLALFQKLKNADSLLELPARGSPLPQQKTLRSVHSKTTQSKTSPGWTPPSESNLTALAVKEKAEASKNLFRRKACSDPLDRGCVSRRRKKLGVRRLAVAFITSTVANDDKIIFVQTKLRRILEI